MADAFHTKSAMATEIYLYSSQYDTEGAFAFSFSTGKSFFLFLAKGRHFDILGTSALSLTVNSSDASSASSTFPAATTAVFVSGIFMLFILLDMKASAYFESGWAGVEPVKPLQRDDERQ